jgi:hypothetical protein
VQVCKQVVAGRQSGVNGTYMTAGQNADLQCWDHACRVSRRDSDLQPLYLKVLEGPGAGQRNDSGASTLVSRPTGHSAQPHSLCSALFRRLIHTNNINNCTLIYVLISRLQNICASVESAKLSRIMVCLGHLSLI